MGRRSHVILVSHTRRDSCSHSHIIHMATSKAMTSGLVKFTSQHIQNLFLPNTAEFVAAAGSIPSIPRSMRLPEVAETARYHSLLGAHCLKRL